MGDYKFPKEEKLKGRSVIRLLFDKGVSFREGAVRLLYLKIGDDKENIVKVGVSVPKKRYKRAVDRNRIKRLIREAYRQNKPAVSGTYAIMFIYQHSGILPSFENILKDIQKLTQKLEKRCKG